ncbi:AlkA N-terminal domain-containing protein, partial [Angustibacter aerolatus]
MPRPTTSRHHLAAQPPYDGPRLLAFVGAHAVPGVEVWDGVRWGRTLRLPGGPGVAQVEAAPGGVDVELTLTDPADEEPALRRLRHLLDVDRDVRPAERHLGAVPLLGPVVARRPGLRAPGSLDDGETLVRIVIGQQVSLGGARTVAGRLVAAAGTPLPAALAAVHPGLTTTFPAPAAVAALDPAGGDLAMP